MTTQNGLRLLVTGATGFLGTHVAARALARKWTVVAQFHRVSASASLPRGVQRVSADFAQSGEVEHCLESAQPTIVIHAAARSSLAECERDPELARRINAEVPRFLAVWCARHAARLVHVSTDLVFGAVPAPSGGFRERDVPAPISV